MASLVHIRTLLIDVIYPKQKYGSLQHFVAKFTQLQIEVDTRDHITNITTSFEALLEVFEKQTRSAGVKSCYDLNEIYKRGRFVLRASQDRSKVLSLRYEAAGAASVATRPNETLEYLLDLRSSEHVNAHWNGYLLLNLRLYTNSAY